MVGPCAILPATCSAFPGTRSSHRSARAVKIASGASLSTSGASLSTSGASLVAPSLVGAPGLQLAQKPRTSERSRYKSKVPGWDLLGGNHPLREVRGLHPSPELGRFALLSPLSPPAAAAPRGPGAETKSFGLAEGRGDRGTAVYQKIKPLLSSASLPLSRDRGCSRAVPRRCRRGGRFPLPFSSGAAGVSGERGAGSRPRRNAAPSPA